MSALKKYLVDIPVRINIWIRPECQRRQFEVIKKARPSILFIQSDGGRNDEEWQAIYANRKMIDEGIDWDCQVYRLYEEKNNGLYSMAKKTYSLIWNTVDPCILLEDDHIPSVSYFRFCAELLEKYKDDMRIECICGFNHLGVYEDVDSDYFFSRQGSIWGIATWRNRYMQYGDFSYGESAYTMNLLKCRTKHNRIAWRRLNAYAKQSTYEGHVAGNEFWIEFNMYSQNRLQIIPQKNMISNIGATGNSSHSAEINKLPRGIRKVFNSKVYDVDFPLKINDYVIPDVKYEKKRNRIMGYNYSIINFYRKFERFVRILASGDMMLLKKKLKRNIQIEK